MRSIRRRLPPAITPQIWDARLLGSNLAIYGGFEGVYDDESLGGGGVINLAPGWNNYNCETDGTDILDASSTAHGGLKSQEINVTSNQEGILGVNLFPARTSYFLVVIYLYGITGTVGLISSGGGGIINTTVVPPAGVWTRYSWKVQGDGSLRSLYIWASGGAAHFLVDDLTIREFI